MLDNTVNDCCNCAAAKTPDLELYRVDRALLIGGQYSALYAACRRDFASYHRKEREETDVAS
jgi:hypothetical protein